MIPSWWPQKPAIYDIHKSYSANLEAGPLFSGEIPFREKPVMEKWVDFLGIKVASPIGVAAGPLLDSKWIKLAAHLAFDIVTYKTIRSSSTPSHPHPNCIFLDFEQPIDPEDIPKTHLPAVHAPKDIYKLSITNSFGMPSQSPGYLKKDIPRALDALRPGQALVVSVSGKPSQECSLKEDFVKVAMFAKECGAPIIEANFSCPNVVSKEGSLYLDPKMTFEIASALTQALGDTPLILKFGHFSSSQLMKEVFVAAAKAKVRAISGINTISMEIKDQNNKPVLGPNRLRSGVCGSAIFKVALNFVEMAHKIIKDEKLNLTLIGVGGVTKAMDFHSFLDRGADFVQTASGMMWDPYLALRYHEQFGRS